jgi:hypothetical protein
MTRKQRSERERTATIALLRAYKVHYREPDDHQIKMGNLNYWPASGKIYEDRAPASLPAHGLQALEIELRNRGYRRSDPGAPAPAPQSPRPATPIVHRTRYRGGPR